MHKLLVLFKVLVKEAALVRTFHCFALSGRNVRPCWNLLHRQEVALLFLCQFLGRQNNRNKFSWLGTENILWLGKEKCCSNITHFFAKCKATSGICRKWVSHSCFTSGRISYCPEEEECPKPNILVKRTPSSHCGYGLLPTLFEYVVAYCCSSENILSK